MAVTIQEFVQQVGSTASAEATSTSEVNDGGGVIFQIGTGTHDGAANASTLTDASGSWETDSLVGRQINNTTDGSNGLITANTGTTVTATLSGGTDNDWDVSDAYTIVSGFDDIATTLTVPVPPGTQDGDLLLVIAAFQRTVTVSSTDFTQELAVGTGANEYIYAGYRTASSEPSSYDLGVTVGSSNIMWGGMLRIDGHDSTNPINVSASAAGPFDEVSLPTAPTVTTDADGCEIIRFIAMEDNQVYAGTGAPTDHTLLSKYCTDISFDMTVMLAHETQASLGATGTAEFSQVSTSASNEPAIAVTIAIAPAEESSSIITKASHYYRMMQG